MSNVKAALETWLRSVKEINNNEDVEIEFVAIPTLKFSEWDRLETIPVRLKLKHEGVVSHKVDGSET